MTRGIILGAVLAACASCAGSTQEPAAPVGISGVGAAPRANASSFAYDSLDARPVTSDALRGKIVVMSFFTTGNIASQAQVNYLMAMAKHDGDRVSYVIVAMEPKANRELIELYRSKLGVAFPTAIADVETLEGRGAFGALDAVPVTLVLDREGRLVWRHVGLAKSDEIRAAMRGI